MKKKCPVREMAEMHDSSSEEEDCVYDKKDVLKAIDIDEELPDFDIDLMVDEKVLVQSIDGVFLEGDDEQAKLLFYYYMPEGIDPEGESIKCKCVAELRTSRKKLVEIVEEINNDVQKVKKLMKRKDQRIYQEKLPMYS